MANIAKKTVCAKHAAVLSVRFVVCSGAGSGGAWRRFSCERCRFSLERCKFSRERCRFSRTRCRFTDRRRRFRVSTVQVPKQGRDLHRESAFYALLLVQVPYLKWNLRHLHQDLQQFCTASFTFFLMEQKNVNYLNRKYFDVAMAFSGLIHPGECAEIQNHFAF